MYRYGTEEIIEVVIRNLFLSNGQHFLEQNIGVC